MNIIDALRDPALFGSLPEFQDLSTWRPWLTWLRAVYGLPMDDEDLALFRKHTGRMQPREGGDGGVALIGKKKVAGTIDVGSLGFYRHRVHHLGYVHVVLGHRCSPVLVRGGVLGCPPVLL